MREILQCLSLFIVGHLCILTIVNNTEIRTKVHKVLYDSDSGSFWYETESRSRTLFNILRKTFSCMMPARIHPQKVYSTSLSLAIAILTLLRWHLAVILVYASLVIEKSEYLLRYPWALCRSPLTSCLFRFLLVHF